MLWSHIHENQTSHWFQQVLEQGLLEVEKCEWNIYKQLPADETAKSIPLHPHFHTNTQQHVISYIYQMYVLRSNNKRPFTTSDHMQLYLFSCETVLTDVKKQRLLLLIPFCKCFRLIWRTEQPIYSLNMHSPHKELEWNLKEPKISKDLLSVSAHMHF